MNIILRVLRKIARLNINLYNAIVIKLFSHSSKILITSKWRVDSDPSFIKFLSFVKSNQNVCYSFVEEKLPFKLNAIHKYVGVQILGGSAIFIPNDEISVLMKENNKYTTKFNLTKQLFKWTGGGYWRNSIYAFPRTSNSLLKITDTEIEEIPLKNKYEGEHHYSGVLLPNGVIYQPPRNTNHILKIDLNSLNETKIEIINEHFKCKTRYCGSVYHPNGFIYFFPENGRVIKLNPVNDEWCFIGKKISVCCFDAKVGVDGNIYGYGAYGKGLLCINVYLDAVKILYPEIEFGAYGTKYGVNGLLYSVPGNGNKIFAFDVLHKKLNITFKFDSNEIEKYAGGATLKNGTIVCAPIRRNSVLNMVPNKNVEIPDELNLLMFSDNY